MFTFMPHHTQPLSYKEVCKLTAVAAKPDVSYIRRQNYKTSIQINMCFWKSNEHKTHNKNITNLSHEGRNVSA